MHPVELFLPALTAHFGQWRFYQVTMKVSEIVRNLGTLIAPNYRIKTVEEVEEIYSERGVSRLLQRAFDEKRLIPIKNYLLMQPDKYVNNLTVAIFGGEPDWLALDISQNTAGMPVNEQDLEFIRDSFGVIKFTGAETLFVLDGQHRLKGLRAAYLEDPEIGEEAISVTLIIHQNSEEGRERTRRLFSTINRHAKPVSLGENILLDEDDVSAIITRRLIEEYKLFKDKEVVALNKTANLYVNQYDSKFTSVLTLYNINEILLENESIYEKVYEEFGEEYSKGRVKIRPDNDIIDAASKIVYKFWDAFFLQFPNAVDFLNGNKKIGLERIKGGRFYLRPIGQEVIAMLYQKLSKDEEKFALLSQVPELITDPFWNFVMWDGNNVLQAKSYIRDYLFYHFGLLNESKSINSLEKNIQKYSSDTETKLLPSLALLS